MPKDRADADDPTTLTGMLGPVGNAEDAEAMAAVFADEFVRMGWSDAEILGLFLHPAYALTHRICLDRGEAFVRGVIRSAREQWGDVWRFHDQVGPGAGQADDMDELLDDVELSDYVPVSALRKL